MATSDKLQNVLDTKQGLKSVIEDNGKTAPTKFEDYPTVLDDIIDGIKGAMIIMDTIKLNASTTLAQLNALFTYLPEANSYTASTRVATITNGMNVRSSGSSSGTALGKVGKTDVIPILGTASSGWYRINKYRYGTSSTAYDNPLKTYNNSSAYISNGSSYSTISNIAYPLKQIDISSLSTTIQQNCNYKIAEAKGWIVVFSTSSGKDTVASTTNTTTYAFNNCYTDNYSSSSYGNKVGTNTSVIRQGYWSGYYYYKGNLRFTSSRLKEIKAIMNNSTVSKMEVYVERANTAHGSASAATVCLYACDSTGRYSDVAVDTSSTLSRGGGRWITVSDTVKNGFASGRYDHFKVYKPSTSTSYYIIYNTNAKIRLTYTA